MVKNSSWLLIEMVVGGMSALKQGVVVFCEETDGLSQRASEFDTSGIGV